DSKVEKNDSANFFQDVNHINFFDIEYPEFPNDDERVANDLNKDKSDSSCSSVFGSNINTADFPVDSRNDADSSDDLVATQNEEVATLKENVFSDPSSSQEMDALLRNGTWELVDLHEGRKAIGSKWIYKIKFRSSGEIYRYKARLLDVNNAFLYGDLEEVVFMKPLEGYFPSDNKSDKGVFLALLVYVDDIIITDTDKGICLNQRKYVLDLLFEYGMLACKPAKTPLMSRLVFSNEASENDPLLENIIDYQKLMGKLMYLTNTRPVISYVVRCLSQFMHSPLSSHLKTAFKILRYLKSCPGLGIRIARASGMFLNAYIDADWAKCIVTRKSVIGYCVLLNNSFVSWKSKKQNTLSKSSTEIEYMALVAVTSEVIWILKILKDLQVEKLLLVSLYCDSNSAIKIAVNPVFHERTKHLKLITLLITRKRFYKVLLNVKVDSAI
ncbi:ribonuclease H-like domain-containing protein, partial [Tanacetum coccineum]